MSSIGSVCVLLVFDKTVDLNKKRYDVSTLIQQFRSKMPYEMSYSGIILRDTRDDDSVSFMVCKKT